MVVFLMLLDFFSGIFSPLERSVLSLGGDTQVAGFLVSWVSIFVMPNTEHLGLWLVR